MNTSTDDHRRMRGSSRRVRATAHDLLPAVGSGHAHFTAAPDDAVQSRRPGHVHFARPTMPTWSAR